MDNNNQFASNKMNDNVLNALYGYYVKYEKLTELINYHFRGSNATTLNIFIDMNDILSKMEHFSQKTNVYPDSDLVIISGLINMAAHYRQFFKTRYGCHTKIWIVNTVGPGAIAQDFFPRYEYPISTFNTPELYDKINTICKFIPDVMVYLSNTEVSSAVIGILEKEPCPNPSIVITKDPFNFQIAGYIPKNPNGVIMVLRPSKFQGQDNSYIVTHDNAIMSYFNAIKSNVVIPAHLAVRGDMLPIYMALTRIPSRKFPSFHKAQKAVNLIGEMTTKDESLLRYPWDPMKYFEKLFAPREYTMKDVYIATKRFQACECVNLQPMYYKEKPDYKAYIGMINLYDPKGVQEINEKYFKNIPLDLEVF